MCILYIMGNKNRSRLTRCKCELTCVCRRDPGVHRALPPTSRSTGGTPGSTPSPKKRQLPAIPLEAQKASRDRGMFLHACLSTGLSVCLPVSACLPVSPSVYLSACLHASLTTCLSSCASANVNLPECLPFCLCLSVCVE